MAMVSFLQSQSSRVLAHAGVLAVVFALFFGWGGKAAFAQPQAVTLRSPYLYSNSQVVLSWSQSYANNFVSYQVYRGTSPGVTEANGTLLETLGSNYSTTYSDTSAHPQVAPGSTFYYRVAVTTADGTTLSNEESITLVDAPPSAVSLSVYHSYYGSGTYLYWNQSYESDFASYKVYRGTSPGVTPDNGTLLSTITNSSSTYFFDETATATPPPGTSYTYIVVVSDAAGQSTPSTEGSMTMVNNPPGAVTIQYIYTGYGSHPSLSWTHSYESDFASYKVYRGTSAGVTADNGALLTTITSADTTYYSDNTATATTPPGTTYTYIVVVSDAAGQSTPSDEKSVNLVDNPPNAVSLSLYSYNGVYVSWGRSTESDVAFYKIYRATTPGVTAANGTLVTTATNADSTYYFDRDAIPGPPPGVTYYYRVAVVDNAGQSTWSDEQSITLVGDAPAPTPTPTVEPTPTATPVPATIDARINNGAGTPWIGEGIINETAQDQEASQSAEAGTTATYLVSVRRLRGNSGQAVRLSVPGFADFENSGGLAHFFVGTGTQDITNVITSANGWTTTLVPGAEALVRVEIVVPTGAATGAAQSLLVKAVDENTSETPPTDAVRASLGVAPSIQPDVTLDRLEGVDVKPDTVGVGVLNDDANQTISWVVLPGQSQTYLAHIKNTGAGASTFGVKLGGLLASTGAATPWAPDGWTASAVQEGTAIDILPALQSAGGWTTPSLDPGAETVVRLTITAPASTVAPVAPGPFRLSARKGAKSDAVVGQLALQFLVGVEWSLDGENWLPVTGPISVPKLQGVGLRGVAVAPTLGWDKLPGVFPKWDVKEPWEAKSAHYLGEVVWFHCEDEGTISFTAIGGRSISGRIVVTPETP